jgi:hypothetical protein
MADKNDGLGDYVRQVRESTQQYARDLLTENEKLAALCASLQAEKRRLEEDLGSAQAMLAGERDRQAALVEQLAQAEESNRSFAERYVDVEQLNSNLANLYVASYRIHGSLDRAEVLSTIQEIVINIIGSEDFVVFERRGNGSLGVVSAFGVDPERYVEGCQATSILAELVSAGATYVAPADLSAESASEGMPLACVPLKVGDRVIGAIAIFRLLQHKSNLESLDYELFNLLATHAATALYCSDLHRRFGGSAGGEG